MDVGLVDRKQNRSRNDRCNAYGIEDKFCGGKMSVCEEICPNQQCAYYKVHCKGHHAELAEVDKGQHKGKNHKSKTSGIDCVPRHVACEKGYTRATGYDDDVDRAVVNLAHFGLEGGILYEVIHR